MSRRLALLCTIALVAMAPALSAQSAADERSAVSAVVTQLFDAMRVRDTAAMRGAFHEGAALQSVGPRGLSQMPIDGWITSVAGAPAGTVLDERLGTPTIQVDGALATVWVDYWFFVGERFSHCGVDALILIKQEGRWRISAVADTRRREGCAAAPPAK